MRRQVLMTTNDRPRNIRPTRASSKRPEVVMKELRDHISREVCQARKPLFVLGAGISSGRVPLIGEMCHRLLELIHTTTIEQKTQELLLNQGERMVSGDASRSDAAEFFSTFQAATAAPALKSLWNTFCRELAMDGMTVNGRKFLGLFLHGVPHPQTQTLTSGPSFAHIALAGLLSEAACHVLSLNYDPLLPLAIDELGRQRQSADSHFGDDRFRLIALHTDREIIQYYASPERQFQPAITNARGDVFYIRCANSRCPTYNVERSLDTHNVSSPKTTPFICATCHTERIELQLSFPGYESKERLVQPVLDQLRQFVGKQTSAIIATGFSGKWDPYLLNSLFSWAVTFRIPLIDVKPADSQRESPFERFRRRYFPSMPTQPTRTSAWYWQFDGKADPFLEQFYKSLHDTIPSLPVLPSAERQLTLV